MALIVLVSFLCALGVYFSGRWWGAPVLPKHRWVAAILTMVVGAAVGMALPHATDVGWFMPMIALLAVIAVVDRVYQIIPNRLVILTAMWAVAARLHYGHWLSAALVAGGVFAFYLAVNVVTRGGLGMGDVKFSAVLALALGYPVGIISLVFGMWAAGIYAAFLLLTRRRQKNQLMALGPFLAIGGLAGLILMLRG